MYTKDRVFWEMVKSNMSIQEMLVGIIDWDVRAQKPPASGPNIHAYPRNILEETSLRRRTNLSPKSATSQLDPMVNQCFVTSFKGRLRLMLFLPRKKGSSQNAGSPLVALILMVLIVRPVNPSAISGKNPLISEVIVKYDSEFAPDGLTNP